MSEETARGRSRGKSMSQLKCQWVDGIGVGCVERWLAAGFGRVYGEVVLGAVSTREVVCGTRELDLINYQRSRIVRLLAGCVLLGWISVGVARGVDLIVRGCNDVD